MHKNPKSGGWWIWYSLVSSRLYQIGCKKWYMTYIPQQSNLDKVGYWLLIKLVLILYTLKFQQNQNMHVLLSFHVSWLFWYMKWMAFKKGIWRRIKIYTCAPYNLYCSFFLSMTISTKLTLGHTYLYGWCFCFQCRVELLIEIPDSQCHVSQVWFRTKCF